MEDMEGQSLESYLSKQSFMMERRRLREAEEDKEKLTFRDVGHNNKDLMKRDKPKEDK